MSSLHRPRTVSIHPRIDDCFLSVYWCLIPLNEVGDTPYFDIYGIVMAPMLTRIAGATEFTQPRDCAIESSDMNKPSTFRAKALYTMMVHAGNMFPGEQSN